MKYIVSLFFLILASPQGYAQEAKSASAPFSGITVKKKKGSKICDTCLVAHTLNAIPDFSYVITGAGHNYTPHRFERLKFEVKLLPDDLKALSSTIHFISQRNIGISFLPNFVLENGKRTQLYRNFGGQDYNLLEFAAKQDGKVIKQWTPFSTLPDDKDNVIMGTKTIADQTISMPWKRTFFAGNFNLDVKDTLYITVRNIQTKQVIQQISIIRPVDKATNFFYYQLPLTGKEFSVNLEHILNMGSGKLAIQSGDSTNVFEKDYGAVGLLRFVHLGNNDEVQYAADSPKQWKSVKSQLHEDAFIVLGNEMQPGKDHRIYLRYKSQPETVHQITIRVKAKPAEIPWGTIAGICIATMVVFGLVFYTLNTKNKKKLYALKMKNEDIETRLSLLSGQLNPHFLFNSLNAIQGTINSDPIKASTYITNVASFMRDVMDSGKKEFVSLFEELKLEENYLKLEQERSQFSYSIAIAADIEASLIDFPPLLLQPVLENSIRHAFAGTLAHPKITLKITRLGNDLKVEISDNGSTCWNSNEYNEGHGLSLTRKRIAVYNERLEDMLIQMELTYLTGRGTITTFTFHNWLA